MFSILYHLLKYVFLLVFPFILLIRGAVYLHIHQGLPATGSILGGILLTGLCLAIYLTYLHGKVAGQIGGVKSLQRRWIIATFVVIGYCLYGLFFFSNQNAKHDAVYHEYRSLHPILRLGVSTIIFLDRELIVTDADRQPEDYKRMGLPKKSRSLHYRQNSGYTHAMDIRTNGRGEIRNFLLKGYFTLMGFNTLRHGGTGDHLHISLYSHDSPGAI